MNLEEMKEKAKKVIEKYPNPQEYTLKMMIAGAIVGASGKYSGTELININIKVLELLKSLDTITDMSEVFLLLEGRGAEFVSDGYDLILSGKIDDTKTLEDALFQIPQPETWISLEGQIYNVIIEEGLFKCPICHSNMNPLNSPMDDPDYLHYRCPKCKMDYKKINKADKDFKVIK